MGRPRNASRQTRDLLETLLASPRVWRHGYELSKETGLKSGTLYPLLMRLSDQGFLDSKWQEPTGAGRPPRHIYRLNSRGVAFAREFTEAPEGTVSAKPLGARA
jgi:PadR family transcriptional regulator, regulatory protein PadR